MKTLIAPPYPLQGNYAGLTVHRRGPLAYMAGLLARDERMRGRVLDIGCGGALPRSRTVSAVLRGAAQLDGVDPDPAVEGHLHLTCRWCGEFEDADIPAGAYDAAYAHQVVEHIRDAPRFFARLVQVLRPGGVFYAYTPHAVHPFALISRAIDLLGSKRLWGRRSAHKVNEYPAYYRLNRLGSILRATRDLDFDLLEMHYLPSVNWDRYFPRPLRLLPHTYDRLVGTRFASKALLIGFRLERSAGS